MHRILSLIIVLLALADMVLGFGFLINPVSSGARLGVAAVAAGPSGAAGLATMRADFTAFFVVAAAFMIVAARRRQGALLAPPLGLFVIAFSGRLVDLLVSGPYPGFAVPMAYEMGHVALLGAAINWWPWRRTAGSP